MDEELIALVTDRSYFCPSCGRRETNQICRKCDYKMVMKLSMILGHMLTHWAIDLKEQPRDDQD